ATLRTANRSSGPGQSAGVVQNTIKLAPDETVAIPLRISFVMQPGFTEAFDNLKAAQQIFDRIENIPAGTVLTAEPMRGITIRKTEDSFGPPAVPEQRA